MFLEEPRHKVTAHFQRCWKNWTLVLGLFFFIPLLLSILDTWDIPRAGNFKEIYARGLPAQGIIESIGQGQDVDDDHWLVVHFVYTHDGRDYFDKTTTDDGDLKQGMRVDVRYLGNQAILPATPPLNIDPTADFWLCFFVSLYIVVPPLILMGLVPIGILFLFRSVRKIALPIFGIPSRRTEES